MEDVFGSASEHTPGQSQETIGENSTIKSHQTKRRLSLQDSETAYFLVNYCIRLNTNASSQYLQNLESVVMFN